jgi:hypothetical protein
MIQVHTVGDSHSTFIHGSFPEWVQQNHLGPKTCYSFGIASPRYVLNNTKPGDSVIFCLGEIDCRCQVHKIITETKTYQYIINYIIDKYFEAIRYIVAHLGVHTYIYNVVPPSKEEDLPHASLGYPVMGSNEERKTYVLYFNKRLKEKCTEYGFTFFDIYDDYVDQDGFLKRELSDGNVHIGNGKFIVKKLESL